MQVLEFADASTFLQKSLDHLSSAEAENNLLLSSALTLAKSSIGRSPDLSFFIVQNGSRVLCAALNVKGRRILLSLASDEAARLLGRTLRENSIMINSIFAPEDTVVAFQEGLTSTEKPSIASGKLHWVYRLTAKRLQFAQPFTQAHGLCRVARSSDEKMLLKWSRLFALESGVDEPEHETSGLVTRYIAKKQLYVWEDPNPVAMAGFGGLTPGGVRINTVYTDPAHRGRGYARSLVGVLSHKLLSTGMYGSCFLMVDSENLAAIKAYTRLGYERIGAPLVSLGKDRNVLNSKAEL